MLNCSNKFIYKFPLKNPIKIKILKNVEKNYCAFVYGQILLSSISFLSIVNFMSQFCIYGIVLFAVVVVHAVPGYSRFSSAAAEAAFVPVLGLFYSPCRHRHCLDNSHPPEAKLII
jgi:hypothetical protein